MFCPNMRLLMVSEWANKPKYLDVMRVRCKLWSCPYCSQMNASLWKRYLLGRLNNHVFGERHWAFITLTADGKYHKEGPKATIANLQATWKRMYDRLRRYNGKPFDYIRIFERHTKGVYKGFHLHVIADLGACYEAKKALFMDVLKRERTAKKLGLRPRKRLKRERHPARWIKDTCRECKGGFIADFRPIEGGNRRAVNYVTKYAVKQLELSDFPPRVRRIQASRAVGSPKTKGTSKLRKWRSRSGIYREDFNVYEQIIDISIKRQITLKDDFSDGELWYPPELT